MRQEAWEDIARKYKAWTSLPALFFHQANRLRDHPFLWAKHDDAYQPMTWQAVEAAVKDLSRGLRALGIERGDRVVVVSENRPEWFIADMAIMAAGAISVPAYTTNEIADHSHILNNSGARGVIVSTPELAAKLLPAAIDAKDCNWVIAIEEPRQDQAGPIDIHRWDSVLTHGSTLPDDVMEIVGQSKRQETACFIYTSGTGGTPKGVMLSHGAILFNCMGAHHLLAQFGLGDEVFLSFLPLSHSYEHTCGQLFPMAIGAQIYYAEGVESLLTNLAEARPTIMTAVPRLYETMHQRIRRGVEKQGGFKQKLFNLAEALGRKRYHDPRSLSLKDRLLDVIVDRLVRDKVRARFGGRLKAFVSGGAALNPDIGIFFTALGLRVLQGYGQTESAPIISANPPRKIKMETVGPPFEEVELKIAEDGEILVRGELVMNGYWRDEEATRNAIQDGWLHTGDVGEIDNDGYIRITDRKKDIIVFSGGDNVSPARVEGFLTLQPEISQAMAYGDKHSHLVALLVPDDDFLRSWARDHGKSPDLATLATDPAFISALSAAVDRANASLSPLEYLRRFTLAAAPFTTENALMTPTLKIRRHKIKEVYETQLEALFKNKK